MVVVHVLSPKHSKSEKLIHSFIYGSHFYLVCASIVERLTAFQAANEQVFLYGRKLRLIYRIAKT